MEIKDWILACPCDFKVLHGEAWLYIDIHPSQQDPEVM